MKATVECKKAIRRMNKHRHSVYQVRARAQRAGINKYDRQYPSKWQLR